MSTQSKPAPQRRGLGTVKGMKRSASWLLILSTVLLAAPADATPASARCEDIYPAMALGPFPADAPNTTSLFYAADDAGSGSFNVRWTGLACGRPDVGVEAEYFDTPGSATEPADYVVPDGQRTPRVCETGCPTQGSVTFPITSDAGTDQAIETFTIGLRNPQGGSLDPPSTAPFVLVDAAGPARVGLDPLEYVGREGTDTLTIAVWRAGATLGRVEVPYTVKPGASAPAIDADYAVTSPNPLVLETGDRLELITLSVVDDELTEGSETLEVELQVPAGAALDAATKTVSIADNEEDLLPTSRFHHPRQGARYASDDFRVREIHVFTEDLGGSGVVRAQMALRSNLRGKRCAWLVGKRFRPGSCREHRWFHLNQYEADFFYHRFRPLRPSSGTSIQSYTAFSRAVDGAGNVERALVWGRNQNTFEIKDPGPRA